MTVSLRKNAEEPPAAPVEKNSKPDIYDIVVRMLIGMLINYITRKLRGRQDSSHDRKKAAKKVDKLSGKGKKIPVSLQKEATAGLSSRQKSKVVKSAEKKAAAAKSKKNRKGHKGHKLFWFLVIAAALGLAIRNATQK